MDDSEAEKLQAKAQNDINEFIKELGKETDRGAALVAAAVVDYKLKAVLQAHVISGLTDKQRNHVFGRQGVLDTFAAKITLCYALGLIDKAEYEEIDLLRNIRNDFAHETYGLSFETDPICSHVLRLKWVEPVKNGKPRAKFLCSTLQIMTRLYYRDMAVGYKRCVTKTWVNEENYRYRTTKDEPPPPGQRVILFGENGPIVAATTHYEEKITKPENDGA